MTDKDVEALRRQTSRRTLVTIKIAIPAMVLLNVTVGVLNFRLASRFASLAGTTFRDVVLAWLEGIDIADQYSGLFVKATERWTTGLLQLTVAILFMVMLAITFGQIARKRRILQYIDETRNEHPAARDA